MNDAAYDLIRDVGMGTRTDSEHILARARSLARDRDHELAVWRHAERGYPDNALSAATIVFLTGVRNRAVELVRDLEARPDLIGILFAKQPSVVSNWLTGWAVRLLPLADQPVYAELFTSEQHELARSGSDQWAQIRHALRVLVRVPLLRRELRLPARERSW